MRISDWSSDVCSSDLFTLAVPSIISHCPPQMMKQADYYEDVTDEGRIIRLTGNLSLACLGELPDRLTALPDDVAALDLSGRSEEHTSELQSLMRISYAVFCLKKKKKKNDHYIQA